MQDYISGTIVSVFFRFPVITDNICNQNFNQSIFNSNVNQRDNNQDHCVRFIGNTGKSPSELHHHCKPAEQSCNALAAN